MNDENMQLLQFLQYMEMFRPDLASRVTLVEEDSDAVKEMQCNDWEEIGS